MIKKAIFKDVFVFLLVITGLLFFSARFATSDGFKYAIYGFLLASILISLPYFNRFSGGFVLPVQIISISVMFSIPMAYYNWNQGLVSSLSAVPYMIWFVFFYLLYIKYPIYKVEKIVMFFGCLYIVLFIFQFINSGKVYFGIHHEFTEDRGVIRVYFPGGGIFFFAYLIALIKSAKATKYKWFFIIFLIAGAIVTIMQVTRQNIFIILLLTIYHFTKNASIPKRIAILSIFSLGLFFALNSDNLIAKGLLETQKQTQAAGDKNMRILAGEYFLTDFSPNLASQIFGNGVPNYNSPLGQKTKILKERRGYYLSDVGIIGFYIMFGIFAIIGYVMIFVKSFFVKIPERYYYLKYYVFYLLATSLTSDSVYSTNFLISSVLVLYCFQRLFTIKRTLGYPVLRFIKSF